MHLNFPDTCTPDPAICSRDGFPCVGKGPHKKGKHDDDDTMTKTAFIETIEHNQEHKGYDVAGRDVLGRWKQEQIVSHACATGRAIFLRSWPTSMSGGLGASLR